MKPCAMLTYVVIRRLPSGSMVSESIAVIRAENERAWLDHWVSEGFRAKLVRRDEPPA
jgi:hypothetical protein